MFGTYQRLNVSVYASWRTVVRAAAGKLTDHARKDSDPAVREARKRFYRQMLEHHHNALELVTTYRL